MSGLLPDYGNQARRYDETRGASPSVLKPLREAIGAHPPAPGPRLLDVGGGTGLERLRADIAAGRPPRGQGTATVLAWTR